MPEREVSLPDCDICDRPVLTINDGALWVNTRAAANVLKEREAFRRQYPTVVSAAQMKDYPRDIEWKWGHRNCPDPGNDGYNITGNDFTSYQTALHWTFHLMEKKWFMGTDWPQTVRRFLRV